MANEISWSNLETDAGIAHYLAGELFAKLYDPTDLRMVLRRREFSPMAGSETMKVSQYDRDHAFAAATSELVGGASNADIGSGNHQLTVARRLLKWTATDLWKQVAPNGSIDLDLLVDVMIGATGLTITDMVTALFGSLSNNVGSSAADMSVDYMYDAQFQLNTSRAGGPFVAVLRPKAYNEFQTSLRAEGGAKQFEPATAEQLRLRGPGFKGEWNGILIWDSDSVPQDGGASYYESAMFGAGCFEYTEAPAAPMSDGIEPWVLFDAGPLLVTRDYDADNGLRLIYGNYYPAVAEAEDARGVEIRSQIA